MSKLIFFKNVRQDQAVRTGVEIDGVRLLQRFEEGKSPSDPALQWWVDVVFAGKTISEDADHVRTWLIENGSFVQNGLQELAEHLLAEIDEESIPFVRKPQRRPPGLACTVKGSSVRRIRTEDMSKHVRDLAKNWQAEIDAMTVEEATVLRHGRFEKVDTHDVGFPR